MEILWTSAAAVDLLEAIDYVSAESPRTALKLARSIREKIELLADNPTLGRAGRLHGTRELVVPGTAYLVVYRVKEGAGQVIRILHGARRPPEPA